MMEKIPADASVIDRLAGTYKKVDGKTEELYKKDGMLRSKLKQVWMRSSTSVSPATTAFKHMAGNSPVYNTERWYSGFFSYTRIYAR